MVVWLKCITPLVPRVSDEELRVKELKPDYVAVLYLAGVDILCCLDSLKGLQESLEFTGHICQALQAAIQEDIRTLRCVPSIFQSYVRSLYNHRSSLFASGSSQSHVLQSKFTEATLKSFESFYSVVRQTGEIEETWRTMASLLEVLTQYNLVDSGIAERFPVFSSISNWAMGAFATRNCA